MNGLKNGWGWALATTLPWIALVLASCGGGAGGGSNNPAPQQNPTPAVTALTPSAVIARTGDTTVKIAGSGFISASTVQWNGTQPLTATLVSASELQALIPAAQLTGSALNQVTVQNPAPGGGTSTAANFTVNSPIPKITSISPRTVPTGNAATITVVGTGFESNSVVMWNNAARPTTVVSATQLQVDLSASDLQNQQVGSLTVDNPGPGASTSSVTQLTVTSQPIPVITSVTLTTGMGLTTPCQQISFVVTGDNLAFDSTIQANGIELPSFLGGVTGRVTGIFPIGFVSQPGALSFTVTNPSQGEIVSEPFSYPAANPPLLTICASPNLTTVYAGSHFAVKIQPSEVNVAGNAALTLGSLPAGITTVGSAPQLPPGGATVHLQAASSAAAGTYDVPLSASVGSATANDDFDFTLSSAAPPSLGFFSPLQNQVGVPIGGSGSIQFQTGVNSSGSVDFEVVPSVTGLPSGTTATFSPNPFLAGESVTVTLSAAGNATVSQNVKVTLTGTPSAQVANATTNFWADVTQPPGALPVGRTDFVSTGGSPLAAAYDPVHNLIFAANNDWNRIDVISNATHKIVKRIPVRSPRWLDISPDHTRVWVQTASPQIHSIDTASLHTTHYTLPNRNLSSGLPILFSNDRMVALSDGTLFLHFDDFGGGNALSAIFNPENGQFTAASGTLFPVRSGDGRHVYTPNGNGIAVYDVATQTSTTIGSGTPYQPVVAVNSDGSRLILGSSTLSLYDQNLTLIGTLPGTVSGYGRLEGGAIFSPDDTKIYNIGNYNGLLAVITINASTLNVVAAAPAMFTDPVATSGYAGTSTPFGVDSAGMVLGLQTYGIAFEDSTFAQNYVSGQPGFNGQTEYIAAFAGPLSGGTAFSLNLFSSLTPDAWFGSTRGSVDNSQGTLTFTSPPSTTPGPVNLKFIYPNGTQGYYPQLFSYSVFPQFAAVSGASPDGGAAARVVGYGLPDDASAGTVTVGPNTATITTMTGQYPALSGEPYPSTVLAYTVPPGEPGWADIKISSSIGNGTLPKALFYAKSVQDFSSADSFTAVLVDERRKQVYLSAGDHVDVFSTVSNSFVAPLHPAATGTAKGFTGLALTPDGSQLLVGNLPDGSLAVINPDSPSNTYAIPIASVHVGINNCGVGPLYVAATSTNLAFVTTGSLPAPSCPPAGDVYVANLLTRAVTQPSQCSGGLSADATADGKFVAIGDHPCLYSAQSGGYLTGALPAAAGTHYGIAISGDGNVIGADQVFLDLSLNMLGTIAHPIPLYGTEFENSTPATLRLFPRLNASGSLYYVAFTSYFDIVDVAHATQRMRFGLSEIIQNVAMPLAIDSGGQHVYLITDKGLTVVDLGGAPLSIGHLSQQNVSTGDQVTVRGSGFDSSVTATVGGQTALVTLTDDKTLTLTMPGASAGPQDVVLLRSDGDKYTLESAVVFP